MYLLGPRPFSFWPLPLPLTIEWLCYSVTWSQYKCAISDLISVRTNIKMKEEMSLALTTFQEQENLSSDNTKQRSLDVTLARECQIFILKMNGEDIEHL